MKAAIVIGIVLVVGLLFLVIQKKKTSEPRIQIARQITLGQLRTVIGQLVDGNMEYDFFGITSDGIDCIYFVHEEGKINIEFEVMVREQQPFVDKLLSYAKAKGIQTSKTTYGNKPHYPELAEAPVYKLTLKATPDQATEIGADIMKAVFDRDFETKLEVVPSKKTTTRQQKLSVRAMVLCNLGQNTSRSCSSRWTGLRPVSRPNT